MSRIGKKPVMLPEKTKAIVEDAKVRVEGPKGNLDVEVPAGISAKVENNAIWVSPDVDNRKNRAFQGLVRALLNNAVVGVSNGYTRTLDIVGVGYRAEAKGNAIQFSLGYSHPVVFDLPKGVTAQTPAPTKIILEGADKQMVGMAAANIRKLRPPEPYKGKGVKYTEEIIKRKVGKTGA